VESSAVLPDSALQQILSGQRELLKALKAEVKASAKV
jgi:hypothetical protein